LDLARWAFFKQWERERIKKKAAEDEDSPGAA
jgi:hypothetical protein